MRLTLRANEKLYLNGAVLRVDRRTILELLNDATFLLESHILQAEDADTPLKQLYFSAQILLIAPKQADQARRVFLEMLTKLLQTVTDSVILSGLRECSFLIREGRTFEILKIVRSLFAQERKILCKEDSTHTKDNVVPITAIKKVRFG